MSFVGSSLGSRGKCRVCVRLSDVFVLLVGGWIGVCSGGCVGGDWGVFVVGASG